VTESCQACFLIITRAIRMPLGVWSDPCGRGAVFKYCLHRSRRRCHGLALAKALFASGLRTRGATVFTGCHRRNCCPTRSTPTERETHSTIKGMVRKIRTEKRLLPLRAGHDEPKSDSISCLLGARTGKQQGETQQSACERTTWLWRHLPNRW
jgi:hypothetical protein